MMEAQAAAIDFHEIEIAVGNLPLDLLVPMEAAFEDAVEKPLVAVCGSGGVAGLDGCAAVVAVGSRDEDALEMRLERGEAIGDAVLQPEDDLRGRLAVRLGEFFVDHAGH